MPVSDLISHRRRWTPRKDGVRACELGSAPLARQLLQQTPPHTRSLSSFPFGNRNIIKECLAGDRFREITGFIA